jgi:hypothetical protein
MQTARDHDHSTADVRVSDLDRERLAVELRDHATDGRLEMDELEQRLELVYAARTRGELEALARDLPTRDLVARQAHPQRRHHARRELREHAAVFVAVNLLLIVVWAASGAGYFWPAWPLLGWGIGLAAQGYETMVGRSIPFCHHGRGKPVIVSRTDRLSPLR